MKLISLLLMTQYEGQELLGVFSSTELAETAAQEYVKKHNIRCGIECGMLVSFKYLEIELDKLL